MQKPMDELLVAYLDGELQPDERAELETRLERDAALRGRLSALGETTALIRTAYAEVLREEVPERLVAAARGRRGTPPLRAAEIVPLRARRGGFDWSIWRRWWVAVPVAASLVGLIIGGGLGYFGLGSSPPASETQVAANVNSSNANWLDNVAGYHKLFMSAVAGDSSFADYPAKDGNGEIIRKISQRTAQQGMRVPDLKPWGLIFQGARVVIIEGRPAAQLFYTADNKTIGKAIGPLTLIIGSSKRSDLAPTFDHRQDVNLLYWRHKGHAYAIVGQADIGYMWGLANDIAWQLGAI